MIFNTNNTGSFFGEKIELADILNADNNNNGINSILNVLNNKIESNLSVIYNSFLTNDSGSINNIIQYTNTEYSFIGGTFTQTKPTTADKTKEAYSESLMLPSYLNNILKVTEATYNNSKLLNAATKYQQIKEAAGSNSNLTAFTQNYKDMFSDILNSNISKNITLIESAFSEIFSEKIISTYHIKSIVDQLIYNLQHLYILKFRIIYKIYSSFQMYYYDTYKGFALYNGSSYIYDAHGNPIAVKYENPYLNSIGSHQFTVGITPIANYTNANESSNNCIQNIDQVAIRENIEFDSLDQLFQNVKLIFVDKEYQSDDITTFNLQSNTGSNGIFKIYRKFQYQPYTCFNDIDELFNICGILPNQKITFSDIQLLIDCIFQIWLKNIKVFNYTVYSCHSNCHYNLRLSTDTTINYKIIIYYGGKNDDGTYKNHYESDRSYSININKTIDELLEQLKSNVDAFNKGINTSSIKWTVSENKDDEFIATLYKSINPDMDDIIFYGWENYLEGIYITFYDEYNSEVSFTKHAEKARPMPEINRKQIPRLGKNTFMGYFIDDVHEYVDDEDADGYETRDNGKVYDSDCKPVEDECIYDENMNVYTRWLYAIITFYFYDNTDTIDDTIDDKLLVQLAAKYKAAMPTIPDGRKPEKTGYEFRGYFTEKDGNGRKYYDDNCKILVGLAVNDFIDDVSFYPYFTPIEITITFQLDDEIKYTKKVQYDDAMPALEAQWKEKTGYIFGGYWSEANGSGIQYYSADGNVMPDYSINNFTTDTTLHAYWTEESSS